MRMQGEDLELAPSRYQKEVFGRSGSLGRVLPEDYPNIVTTMNNLATMAPSTNVGAFGTALWHRSLTRTPR